MGARTGSDAAKGMHTERRAANASAATAANRLPSNARTAENATTPSAPHTLRYVATKTATDAPICLTSAVVGTREGSIIAAHPLTQTPRKGKSDGLIVSRITTAVATQATRLSAASVAGSRNASGIRRS